jgi:hypothetical protein
MNVTGIVLSFIPIMAVALIGLYVRHRRVARRYSALRSYLVQRLPLYFPDEREVDVIADEHS